MQQQRRSTADQFVDTAVTALPDDAIVGRESHENAPAIVTRADRVQTVLSTLRSVAGLDHCSCVTAQEYDDRFETVYHLTSYDDRTRELSVVVPTTKDDPVSESAAPVYRTAEWHEREAYDLLGIEYEDHPDLRRLLLTETWQGHPLREDYDQTAPQVVPLREHADPLQADDRHEDSDTMFINIGPHHPSTHGVLHLETTLDGEQVADVEPDIGYIHRCEEQMCQQGTYRHQIMPYPDRWDWGGAGLLNEWAYARVIEDLADIDVPEYALVIRTMSADGTETPARFKIRGPSFSHLSALPAMARGEYVADLVATIGSLDAIMGEVDR
ncbi:hypothetical protein EAF64_00485 [Halorientalis pallida]|uniref:NADH dehydrogenase subunit C n=1 Tax=Halorientalis pallida TaxID=2479928 RepID=A0A498KYL3_9EURY|nr:NADH-quinone oxidoreductase subunit C [Halorientalis pallida]RXK51159.1 hypothetical protein EAF64_00485 [Halorientalis pallida]